MNASSNPTPVTAEIIAVGTEILLGDLVDTNSVYLAEQLRRIGVHLHLKTAVGDNLQRLTAAIAEAHERANIVITSGGLGPTVDDLTREAVAAVADVPLVYSQELMDQIEAIFTQRGFTMSPNNRKQAYIPEGAVPIENPVGTAPCFIVEDDRGVIIALPGVPRELKFLMESRVLPYLRRAFSLGDFIQVRVLKTCALGESHVDHLIHDLFESSRNPTIAVLAHPGQVDVRLTAKGNDSGEVDGMLDDLETQIRQRVGAALYGYGNDTVEGVVGRILRERNKTLAVLESNTGGALAARLSSVSGSAQTIKGGWVSTSAEFVSSILGSRSPQEISRPRAAALAQRVRELAEADIGLAVLGPIPAGEELAATTAEATYMALAEASGPVVETQRSFGGGGRFFQDRATVMALDVLRRHLLEVEQLAG